MNSRDMMKSMELKSRRIDLAKKEKEKADRISKQTAEEEALELLSQEPPKPVSEHSNRDLTMLFDWKGISKEQRKKLRHTDDRRKYWNPS